VGSRILASFPGVGVILAGGRSRRFGRSKAQAALGGDAIIDRVIMVHRHVMGRPIIVGEPVGGSSPPGVPVVADLVPGLGPLGGLHTALLWAQRRGFAGVLCTPCDAPFVEVALLRSLLDRRSQATAVLPRHGPAGLEPLFGWYAAGAIPTIQEAIRHDRLSMYGLLERLPSVEGVPIDELGLRNDPELVFLNVNTPGDYELARARFGEFVPDES
jgi:molybdenum cofactor guanylyltransferase